VNRGNGAVESMNSRGAGTLKEVTRFRLVQRLHTLCKLGTQSISASSCEARARQSCTKLNTTAAEMKDQHGGSDA
jgi:hypothetical protein